MCKTKSITTTYHARTCMHARTHACTHTHTHPFYGPLDFVWDYLGELVPEPIWILQKQETLRGSGISWAIGKSAPHHRDNHASTHHSVFAGPSSHPTNSVKALKAKRKCKLKSCDSDISHIRPKAPTGAIYFEF